MTMSETREQNVKTATQPRYIRIDACDNVAVVVNQGGLPAGSVPFEFSGGSRGWKGDVPVVRINTSRIRSLGWTNTFSSGEALRAAMMALITDERAGRL